VIEPVKLDTNSRPSTNVQLSRPGVSWASIRCSPVRGSMRSTCPVATCVETMNPSASNLTESGTPSPVATVSGAPPSGSMRQISLAPITGKYSRPSGPNSMALGDGTFSSRMRGGPPARSNSISLPPSRHSPMNSRPSWNVMPFADGTSSLSTRVVPPDSRTLTRPSMTSVANRLPLGSKATSSGAMMSPPLALTVSSSPVAMSSALI
jgi:hypothetical protein